MPTQPQWLTSGSRRAARSSASAPTKSALPDATLAPRLVEAYRAGLVDLRRLARDAGLAEDDARRLLIEAGVDVRGRGRPPRRSTLTPILTEAYLRREYLDRGRSAADIASEVGCDHKTVLRHLYGHGLSARPRTAPNPVDPEFLRREYVRAGRTARDIAAELGCSVGTVRALLARHSIRRS